MSLFTEFTSVEIPSKHCKNFRLTAPLVYERYYEGSGEFVIVPAWFETDFATLPLILQIFWKPYDHRWWKPAIVHDHEWNEAETLAEYQEANDNFYDGMLACGTPYWIAFMFYSGVNISKYGYWAMKKLKRLFS